ncbi:MAG: hypothetical protein KJ698_03300 [Actinobacteria bacterium]|nr:hypothetical protein [Actinomycetota bacterium]
MSVARDPRHRISISAHRLALSSSDTSPLEVCVAGTPTHVSPGAAPSSPGIRWVRVGWWLLCTAIAVRVVTVLVITRGWLFTNDDWDYLTRDGLGQAFLPHQGHINVFIAIAAVGLRRVVALDYWPGYGLVVAVAWPAAALAAWWLWRRRGVHPLLASGGAILIAWSGAASYMAFSQVGPAWALAASLIALDFDQRPLSRKNAGLGLAISLVAVFAGTLGAIVAGVRLVVGGIRRQWNGVITAGIAFVAFVLVRASVAAVPPVAIGVGDIPTMFRVVSQVLGIGLHQMIPYPAGFEAEAGYLLMGLAITLVVARRFEYVTTAIVVGAGAWVAAAAVAKFINLWSAGRLEYVLSGDRVAEYFLLVRFANVMVVAMLVAFIAGHRAVILPRFADQRPRAWLPVIGVVLLAGLAAFNIDRSLDFWRHAPTFSRAEITGGVVTMYLADEPRLTTSRQRQTGAVIGSFRLHRTLDLGSGIVITQWDSRLALQRNQLDWLDERGWAESILRSDVYEVRQVTPDTDWARALLRFGFSNGGRWVGSWLDLGMEADGCVPLSSLGTMEVVRTTRFELGWDDALPAPTVAWTPHALINRLESDMMMLRLEDDYGRSEIGITIIRDPEADPLLTVDVLGPEAGTGPVTLTVAGPSDAVMCHRKG